MKSVNVVSAIICDNVRNIHKVFATARGYGEFKGLWEFPGGKIEDGETPQTALKREIMEELDTTVSIIELIETVEYDYSTFHLSMKCFLCEVLFGTLVLKEAMEARWLSRDELYTVQWLPADQILLPKLKAYMKD